MGNLVDVLNNIGFIDFYNSTFFSIVKFILGIYAVVLLADIILLLIQRGLSGDIRETLLGMNVPAELVTRKSKLRKKWMKIRERMAIGTQEGWKIAIIEADEVIDDLLKRMGYSGENMGERLANMTSQQVENIEELKKAHEMKNRIIHEENLELTKEQVEETMGHFENFLRSFGVL